MKAMVLGVMLLLASFIAALPAQAGTSGERPLVLAVHPYLPYDEIISRFTPLAHYIAGYTGRKVVIKVGRNYDEHIRAIADGDADIAYMGPSSYVEMVSKYGKRPLLARQVVNNSPYLRGEIIVRRDSPIKTLSDLKNKCVILGDPDSTMSSILPLLMLKHSGVRLSNLAKFSHIEGHENVALAVLAGDCDAGAVKSEVFDKFAPRGLRALAELPLVSDHVFVASDQLPPDLVSALRSAFNKLNQVPEGKAIMTSIHPEMTALVPAKDSDYDSLRKLMNLKRETGTH